MSARWWWNWLRWPGEVERKKNMKTNAGLWIDHREAVIVVLTGTGPETKRIRSAVEKQLRRSGEPDHGSFEHQGVPADDSRQREYTGDLARYYDAIISHVRDSESILIFGPGEAKGELEARFKKLPGTPHTITLETTDKMTEPQIVAMVCHHFQQEPQKP
jgi:hypothetical protein